MYHLFTGTISSFARVDMIFHSCLNHFFAKLNSIIFPGTKSIPTTKSSFLEKEMKEPLIKSLPTARPALHISDVKFESFIVYQELPFPFIGFVPEHGAASWRKTLR